MMLGFPADLFAETRFITGGFDGAELFQEAEQNGFKEVPIFGCGK